MNLWKPIIPGSLFPYHPAENPFDASGYKKLSIAPMALLIGIKPIWLQKALPRNMALITFKTYSSTVKHKSI